jgi:hypothetical protein
LCWNSCSYTCKKTMHLPNQLYQCGYFLKQHSSANCTTMSLLLSIFYSPFIIKSLRLLIPSSKGSTSF